MAEDIGLRAVVRGRVQRVYFRDFVFREARRLELRGYVRNLPDGKKVEILAEGPREALEELLRHLCKGPPSARVEGVDAQWLQPSWDHSDFQVIW